LTDNLTKPKGQEEVAYETITIINDRWIFRLKGMIIIYILHIIIIHIQFKSIAGDYNDKN